MHTLSEQFHATNMVRLAKAVRVHVRVGVLVCVCVRECYRCSAAAVLGLETEADVGMQWICQCSEC